MSGRRARPPNKAGCKPKEDVCVELRRHASETRTEALEAVARLAKAALAAAESKASSDFAFVKHLVPEINDLSNAIKALEKTQ